MPGRIDRIACQVLGVLLPCIALAQAPQWPSAEDLERALRATPFPSAERLGAQPIPQPPRVEAQREAIDIEALARSKVDLPNAAAAPQSSRAALRIFITLAMPRASLELLTEQAARSGAVLVLRGLKSQSMRETLAVVRDLAAERNVAWLIDPEAFSHYAVRHAPTFVLQLDDVTAASAQGTCTPGCATPEAFVSVAGDVSLGYALETMLRRRPETAPRVEPILKRLRGS